MIKRSLPSQKRREQQMSTQDGRNQKQLYPEQDQPGRPGNPGPGQGPDDPDKNAPSRENPAEPQDPEEMKASRRICQRRATRNSQSQWKNEKPPATRSFF